MAGTIDLPPQKLRGNIIAPIHNEMGDCKLAITAILSGADLKDSCTHTQLQVIARSTKWRIQVIFVSPCIESWDTVDFYNYNVYLGARVCQQPTEEEMESP